MQEWLVKKLGKGGLRFLLFVLVVALIVGGYYSVKNYFQGPLKTEVKVSKNLTNAMSVSGHEAVDTVGNRQDAEQQGAATVQESQHEIDNATDPGSVTDAGLNGLHRVRGQASPRHRPGG
jgi:hypothetical protein